jgi:hypothetical protein
MTTHFPTLLLAGSLAVLAAAPAAAQATAPEIPGNEVVPKPEPPCNPAGTAHETLSDQLSDCSGVLRPSQGIDPEIQVPAPPSASNTPVIRPETGHVDPK